MKTYCLALDIIAQYVGYGFIAALDNHDIDGFFKMWGQIVECNNIHMELIIVC